MKKFTEKQIITFKNMVMEGVIDQIDTELARSIIEKLYNIEEGRLITEVLSAPEVIIEWDSRGESYELVENIIENSSYGQRILSSIIENHIEEIEVNRKTMIKLLRLRDFANKEDIIKELNEIL